MQHATKYRLARHEDRSSLQRFVCADPADKSYNRARRRHHPRPWQHVAQSYVRTLEPPFRDGSVTLLREVDGVIAGVCHLMPNPKEGTVLVAVIAIALAHQGKGAGAELLHDAIDFAEREWPHDFLIARIDERNEPSKRLFRSAEFQPDQGLYEREQTLRVWFRE